MPLPRGDTGASGAVAVLHNWWTPDDPIPDHAVGRSAASRTRADDERADDLRAHACWRWGRTRFGTVPRLGSEFAVKRERDDAAPTRSFPLEIRAFHRSMRRVRGAP